LDFLIYPLTFIIGVLGGWVANVLAERFPYPDKPLFAIPRCVRSGERLSVRDYIPVLGWALQRGKCRHCGKSLPRLFIIVELALGVAFVCAWIYYIDVEKLGWLVYAVNAFFIWLFGVIALIDWRYRLIFPVMIWMGCAISLLVAWLIPPVRGYNLPDGIASSLIGAALCGGVFYIIYVVAYSVYKKRALGWGDVLLAILIGAALGFPRAISALLLGAVLGGFAALIFFVTRRKGWREFIPYGTSLCMGVILVLVFGQAVWRFGPFGLIADLIGLFFNIVYFNIFQNSPPPPPQ
jgi:leader peptidase (prepilin peptidase) / N-methyltransferase